MKTRGILNSKRRFKNTQELGVDFSDSGLVDGSRDEKGFMQGI